MKKITPRINKNTVGFLTDNFKNLNAGSEYLLDAIPSVARVYAGYQLKGVFSADELQLMIDVMNSTMLSPQLAGQHLKVNVEDGIALDHLDKKWEINGNDLISKLGEMSVPEVFFLEIWIQGFWVQSDDIELEDYIQALV